MNQKPGFMGWLIRKGFAHNEKHAEYITLLLFLLCIALIFYILAHYVFGIEFSQPSRDENAGPYIETHQRLKK